MVKTILALLSLTGATFALSGPASAQVYKWTDEKGEVHYTDNSYDLKDAKGKGSLIIPAKKAAKEPEQEPDAQEAAVQPAQDKAQETKAEDKPSSPQTVNEPKVAGSPTPTAKAPAEQQPPAKPVKMSKRLLKAQKLEKDKAGSGQASSPEASR